MTTEEIKKAQEGLAALSALLTSLAATSTTADTSNSEVLFDAQQKSATVNTDPEPNEAGVATDIDGDATRIVANAGTPEIPPVIATPVVKGNAGIAPVADVYTDPSVPVNGGYEQPFADSWHEAVKELTGVLKELKSNQSELANKVNSVAETVAKQGSFASILETAPANSATVQVI
jgi:hypothetical protein